MLFSSHSFHCNMVNCSQNEILKVSSKEGLYISNYCNIVTKRLFSFQDQGYFVRVLYEGEVCTAIISYFVTYEEALTLLTCRKHVKLNSGQ